MNFQLCKVAGHNNIYLNQLTHQSNPFEYSKHLFCKIVAGYQQVKREMQKAKNARLRQKKKALTVSYSFKSVASFQKIKRFSKKMLLFSM